MIEPEQNNVSGQNQSVSPSKTVFPYVAATPWRSFRTLQPRIRFISHAGLTFPADQHPLQ